MGSLSGKRANPGNSGRKGVKSEGGVYDDPVADEALEHIEEGVLCPDMSREFGEETLQHIEYELLPRALKAKDSKRAALCETVLAKYGRAVPNHVSGLWEPLDVPRNELQVRSYSPVACTSMAIGWYPVRPIFPTGYSLMMTGTSSTLKLSTGLFHSSSTATTPRVAI